MTMKFGFGQPLTRKEDDTLLRGAGRYIADVAPAATLHAVVVRSPHAHAHFQIGDPEAGMRMRRTHHNRMQRRLRRNVGDVTPRPAQERVVFLACERLAESEFHGHLRPSAFVGRLEGSCCPRRADKCTAIQRVTT